MSVVVAPTTRRDRLASGAVPGRATNGALVVAALVLGTFSVYLATLSSGALGGDAGELQFVPPILGLPHPTGYPLQVLVHKAWSLVPLGSVAYRLNLLDAAIAALAVGLVAMAGHILAGRWPPAVAGAVALAFGELWWSQAVRGDKYTLNGLFLALVLILFLRWRRHPRGAGLSTLAFVYGLSLAHHRSMLLVAPALALGLVLTRWRPCTWGEVVRPAALVLLPLALYAYVPWAGSRGLPPGAWPVDTPGAFVEFLLDRGYTGQIRPDAALAGRLAEEAVALARSFGPLGVLLGVIGVVGAFVRDWRTGLVLVAVFVPQAVLGASYRLESNYVLPRHWVFYLPGFVVWALWISIGSAELLRGVGRMAAARTRPDGPWWRMRRPDGAWDKERLPRPDGAWSRATLSALVVLGLGVQIGTAWLRAAVPLVRAEAGAEPLDVWRQDLQRSPLADRFGRLALAVAEPGATIVCDWEQATVLWYLQQVEGQRPDLTIRYPLERLDDEIAIARATGHTVYLSRALAGLESRGVTSSRGPLLQIFPAPTSTLPPGAIRLDARFEQGLLLAGVEYHAESLRAGSVVPFTLLWTAGAPLADDIAVSVRLLNARGEVLATHDERHPALGTSPTSRWQPGQVIGDYRELPLGSLLPPGEYRLAVVPYRVDPIRELRPLRPDGQPEDPPLLLDPIRVKRSSSAVLRLYTSLRDR